MTSHLSVFCPSVPSLVLLPPETAALSKPGSAPGWLAEDSGAAGTHDHSLSVTEHRGDPVTAGTLDVHEVAVGVLDQPFQLVLPLFLGREGVQQILSKRHLYSSES